MKYKVISTAAGYIVQNTVTYGVVAGPYSSEAQAKSVVHKLSGTVINVVKETEKEFVNNLNSTGDK